jgi:methylated-DNA-protein-cysteine methyltransferase related protein
LLAGALLSRTHEVTAVAVHGFADGVSQVLAELSPGTVMSYGEVAREAGYPGAARAVGNLLARGTGHPWWRVVSGTGRLVPGHEREHARLLRAEGVRIADGHVLMHGRRRAISAGARRTGSS